MKTTKFEPHYMATRDEVEEIFGYPTRRALELFAVNGGGPRVTRIGRRCFHRVSDVETWLRSFEIKQSSEPKNVG
jgi:hypothetical protein